MNRSVSRDYQQLDGMGSSSNGSSQDHIDTTNLDVIDFYSGGTINSYNSRQMSRISKYCYNKNMNWIHSIDCEWWLDTAFLERFFFFFSSWRVPTRMQKLIIQFNKIIPIAIYIADEKNSNDCERHSSRIFDADIFFWLRRINIRANIQVWDNKHNPKMQKKIHKNNHSNSYWIFFWRDFISLTVWTIFQGQRLRPTKLITVAFRHSASSDIYNWLYLKSVKWHTIKLDSRWKWVAIYFIQHREMKWTMEKK